MPVGKRLLRFLIACPPRNIVPSSPACSGGGMKRFEGKTALVTGAGSGIGRAVALRLAEEGASVFCVDVQLHALEETVSGIRGAGGVAEARGCDVTDEAAVRRCIAQCIERFGRLDQLSNMAGILRFDHFHEISLADFRRVLDVNLVGTFLMCREALPHLLASGGNIVNAASTSSLAGLPWGGAYSASKGGFSR